jgi:hypothetical protein
LGFWGFGVLGSELWKKSIAITYIVPKKEFLNLRYLDANVAKLKSFI